MPFYPDIRIQNGICSQAKDVHFQISIYMYVQHIDTYMSNFSAVIIENFKDAQAFLMGVK